MGSETDIRQHKLTVSSMFDTVAPGYDDAVLRFFPFCADHVVKLLNLRPGQKVLDMATGTGAVAQSVRPGGRVIGIDLSEGLLARAEQNTKKMALDNVDLFLMDAEDLEFMRNKMFEDLAAFGVPPADLRVASEKLTEDEDCRRLVEQAGLSGARVQEKQLGYH